ncbi:APC family permease [Steroidobacter sp. S1-65]|uniref:APC family permease n=1 Tax=Steroidobacter gossypii TaxID=2805490 RepID=A0ABS1WRW4_9GAMM|nr:APC family permease [Steroidobacter gossypii]MBM0103721.1 APC family permease [Steroidobacter gossypii]
MQSQLKQGVDLAAVVALGLGTAVGVAIFSVIAPATALAGTGMLLSVMIAAVPMFVIAVNYAFMGSALPTSGASYEWPRRFIHPAVGFFVAWLRIAGSSSAMIVLALVLVRYVSMLVPVPTKPTMLALFVLVLLANLFGVGIAARVQKTLMGALVVLFLIFAGWGATAVESVHFSVPDDLNWAGVLAAVPLLVSLFFGIEAATEVGDEVSNGRRMIPLGIALSITSAVALYLLVAVVALGILGNDELAASQAPILDAASRFMGPLATPVIVLAAVVAIGKSLNAIFMVFSRSLFAMARAGVLPPALARVHPRWGTPHVACLAVFGFCVACLLLPMSLTFLFLSVSIPTLLKYVTTSLCATRVVEHHPDLYKNARFRFSPGAMRLWGYAGVLSALTVIVLGLGADTRPYYVLLGWGAIGALYYVLWQRLKPAA